MAYTSPLRNLRNKKSTTKKDEEEEYVNKYDDGGIWSKSDTPETYIYESPLRNLKSSKNNTNSGFRSGITIQEALNTEKDPLQSARNQVDYYTGKLHEAGIKEQKPSLWQRMKSSGGDLVIDLLNRVGAVAGAGSNTLAGTLDSTFENTDAIVKAAKGKELTEEEAERLRNTVGKDPGTRMAEDLMAGVKSGLSTLGGLFTGEYSDKNVDFGVLLENVRDNDEILTRTAGSLIELPGKAIAKNVFGASDETADRVGNMIGDLGISIATGNITDIDGSGKALKYLNNVKAIEAKGAVTNLAKATKLADDTLKYADYVETLGDKASKYSDEVLEGMFKQSKENYALDLMKEADKAVGGMADYKGLTMGKKVVLSKEALKKISENKVQKVLATVGLSVLSPVSVLSNNPVLDKITKVVGDTEVGKAISNTFDRSFVGGKKSDWVLSAKKNPEKALEYMNQAKSQELAKKVSDIRIQKTMDKINKYSDVKESPEDITRIIEKPETVESTLKEVEKEINNPQYIKKMMDLSNEAYKENIDEINKLKDYINVQKAELEANKADIPNYETVKVALDKKIESLEKRSSTIETTKRAKSIDYNKQMKSFGFKGDYEEHFDDALNMSIEDLTKKVGDEDLAYALNESANRVLDIVDEKVPGLAKYYTQSGTVTSRYSKSMDYQLPDEVLKKFNEAGSYNDKIRALDEELRSSMENNGGRDEIKLLQTKKEMTTRSNIKKIIRDNNITGVDKEYEYFLDSVGGEELMKQHKFFENKQNYASALREKVKNSKPIRELLGNDNDNLIHDVLDLVNKRINGEDSLQIGLSNTAKNNSKMDRLNNLRLKKTTGEAIVHQDDIEVLTSVAEALKHNDPNLKFQNIYGNKPLPNRMAETKKEFDKVFDRSLGYAESPADVLPIAKAFMKESGMDKGFKSVKEVAKGLYEATSKNEAMAYIGRLSKEYGDKLTEDYRVMAMYMTDDEIQMVLDQNSTFRNVPAIVKKAMKEYQEPKAEFDNIKKAKESSFNKENIKVEDTDDTSVLAEKRVTDLASENKTEQGVSRDNWIDQEEEKRFKADTGKGKYDGTKSEFIDNKTTTRIHGEEVHRKYRNYKKYGRKEKNKIADLFNPEKLVSNKEDVGLKREEELRAFFEENKYKKEYISSGSNFTLEDLLGDDGKDFNWFKNKYLNEELHPELKVKNKKTPIDKLFEDFKEWEAKNPIAEVTELPKVKENDGMQGVVESINETLTNKTEDLKEVAYGEDNFDKAIKDRFGEVKTNGLKFDTPTGSILIDKKMRLKDFDKIINPAKYDGGKIGAKIIYTTDVIDKSSPNVVAKYLIDKDTIIVNMDMDRRKTLSVLEHEFGHRITQKITSNWDTDLLTEAKKILVGVRGLEDVDKKKLMEIAEYAIEGNGGNENYANIGLFTGYLAKLSKQGTDKELMGNEFISEVLALYNNPNTRISNKFKKLSPELTKTIDEYVAKLKPEEIKNVIPNVRKRYGDDVAQELISLKMEKESLEQVASTLDETINNKIKIASETKEELEEMTTKIEKAMDSSYYDENGDVINKGYDDLYSIVEKRYGKEYVASSTKDIEKYKKVTHLEEEVFRIDNTKGLSDEALDLMDEFKEEMKEIALRENIYTEDQAEAWTTYLMHEINPKYSDQAEIIEKGRQLEIELRETFNKNKLTRTKEGTIHEINDQYENEIGVRIFEENINRLWLKRRINSEKVFKDEAKKGTLLKSFSIPIIKSVDEELRKNTKYFDELIDDEVLETLGMDRETFMDTFLNKNEGTVNDMAKSKFNFKDFYENHRQQYEEMEKRAVEKFLEENPGTPLSPEFTYELGKERFNNLKGRFTEEGYYKKLSKELGFKPVEVNPLDNIPLRTDDKRPYVKVGSGVKKSGLSEEDIKFNKLAIESLREEAKKRGEMPYELEGYGEPYESYKQGYQDFVYKKAKEKGYVMIPTLEAKEKNIVTKRVVSDQAVERAITKKSNVMDEIGAILNNDIDAIDEFTSLNDSVVIKVSDLKYEEFQENLKNNKMLIDKEAWENYKKEVKEAEFKQKAPLLKAYDAVSRLFSSQALFNVGFHSRNAVQNTVASYVKAGVNLLSPTKNKEALDILTYMAGNKDFTKEIGGYNIDAFLRELEVEGIFETEAKNLFDRDVTKKFLDGETDKLRTTSNNPLNKLSKGYQSSAKTTIGKAWDKTSGVNPMSSDFIGYKGSRVVGDKIEAQAKLINVLTHLDNGMNLTDAIHMTKETLFDYSDLTKFEKNVMKRAMPFYTFMRKNLPSQVDNMMNHQGRMTRITNIVPKSYNDDTEKERALRPEYLDGQVSLGAGKFLNIGDATRDLEKLYNPLEALSSLNSIVKTPIELAFNTQLYSGSDISKFDKMSEKVQYVIESNLPILKQMSALANANSSDEEARAKAHKTLKKFAGSMVNEYDMDKQEKSTMYDYVDLLENQYYEALEKNPELFQTEKVNKTSQYESPLSKLKYKKKK